MINPFDLDKHHELCFTQEPPEQAARALTLLGGLSKLKVSLASDPCKLDICYNLRDYTLAGLEHALIKEGFFLNRSFLHTVERNVIYYCEDTMLHNMEIPDHLTKKNEKDVFVEVHEQHTHDNQAAIPPQSRRYE